MLWGYTVAGLFVVAAVVDAVAVSFVAWREGSDSTERRCRRAVVALVLALLGAMSLLLSIGIGMVTSSNSQPESSAVFDVSIVAVVVLSLLFLIALALTERYRERRLVESEWQPSETSCRVIYRDHDRQTDSPSDWPDGSAQSMIRRIIDMM